jgi:pyrimidine operon attenuation protein/uracil phosphoribosyltransferase
MQEPILILDKEDISQKLNRLAYQVYEQNYGEESVLVCGIQGRGYILAARLAKTLESISPIKVMLAKVIVDKENPNRENIHLEPEIENIGSRSVILCDDVLYTGKTLAYAAMPFLEANVKKLQCLVLIHRNHLTFPIQPRFIGLSLATTLQERVEVDFEKEKVWLVE